jgi:peptide subunit release factor 1 (eRF1)
MLTDSDLKELLSYQAESPVLSIYLNTNPAEGNADAYKLQLRSMLKEVNLPEDVAAVIRFFDHEHLGEGKSVALFSNAPNQFFRAYALAVPVRSRVRVSDRPHVKPLADLFDSYGNYGILLVDKQGMRLFTFHLGELREHEGFMGEEVRHIKRGGGSQYSGKRGSSAVVGRRGNNAGQTNYSDEVAERNVKAAADYAVHFLTENNVRRVLIAGADDTVALFRSQLPKAWQSLVVGTFHMGMTSGPVEIIDKAMVIGRQADEQRELVLVEKVVTGTAKAKGGVMYPEETLRAVHEGRVQILLIQDGFRIPGWRCSNCGFISTLEFEACPYCNGKPRQVVDAIELAVEQVMQAGGEVEVLHAPEASQEIGDIGGLLRY